MFWRYNLISGSCIETLLEKENVTLKELMDEDDILQECKAQTRKLLDFLVRPEVLDEMISLIVQEPENEGDERLQYRYANKACEMLTFDIAQINDALVSDEKFVNKLYDFLKSDEALNPLLASFFSKTIDVLIIKKTEFMLDFLKQNDFLTLILKHLNTSAIMDLLLRVVSIENPDYRPAFQKWLNEEKLIQQLVSRIDVEYAEEFNCNASHALCDIIKTSKENLSILQEKADPVPLLETMESKDVVNDLLNHMFKDVTKESAIVNGILVLLSLLVFKRQVSMGLQQMSEKAIEDPISEGEFPPPSYLSPVFNNKDAEADAEKLSFGAGVITAIIPRLGDFHNLLLKPPVKPAITFTIGCLDPPLGICRLEVAHLLTALLSANHNEVNSKLASLETVSVLLDMFFKYSWNNFLHTQVEQAVGKIISNPPTVDNEGNKVHPLLDQLFNKYEIIIKILECFEEDPVKPVPGVHRKGYMGHLTKIANSICQGVENGINSDLIKEYILKLSEEHQTKWAEFVSGKLADINKKTSDQSVATVHFEDDVHSSVMEKNKRLSSYNDFQMHEMTSNFVDQFGFNEDDFDDAHESLIYFRNTMNPLSQTFPTGDGSNIRSEELFEEVCSSKLNTEEGEGDLWTDRDNPSTFVDCFGLNKSTEENSSDSDEEAQVFESETTPPIPLSSEEMKMDVDGQEPILEGVPMDVAPVTISDPWGAPSPNSGSEEQQNWADFSNFSPFDTTAAVIAMETSDGTDKTVTPSDPPEAVCNSTEESASLRNTTSKNPELVQTVCKEHESSIPIPTPKDTLEGISEAKLSSSQ